MKIALLLICLICLIIAYILSNSTPNGTGCPPVSDEMWMWSKGPPPHTAYNILQTEKRSDHVTIREHVQKCGKLVWIRTGSSNVSMKSDLDIFAEIIDELSGPIVLVTSDGDRSIPSELESHTFQRIVQSPHVKTWLTQNYDDNGSNYKLKPYPIGLDLHTVRSDATNTPEKKLQTIAYIRDTWKDKVKIHKIFCDVSTNSKDRFGQQRKKVVALLSTVDHAHVLEKRMKLEDVWNQYAKHTFVVCPPGNGRDTHRCWEVLALGSIPIVLSSTIDPLFKQLPVIILQKWEHITNLTYINKLYHAVKKHEFTMQFSINLITESLQKA